jgi:hypothetical protein
MPSEFSDFSGTKTQIFVGAHLKAAGIEFLGENRRPRRAPAQAPAAEEAQIILKGQGGESRANRPRLECAKL